MSPDPQTLGNLTESFRDALARKMAVVTVVDVEPDDDRETTRLRIEAAQRAGREARALLATPARWRDCRITEPAVSRWCDELIEGSSQGLLLVGPVGVGKTYQAWAAVNTLRMAADGPHVHAVTSVDLLDDLRDQTPAGRAAMQACLEAPLLFVDDLGGEKPTDWTAERLYRVFNWRYDRLLPVIVTTNVGRAQLEEAIGDRTVSRLFEMTTRVGLTGDDRRKR